MVREISPGLFFPSLELVLGVYLSSLGLIPFIEQFMSAYLFVYLFLSSCLYFYLRTWLIKLFGFGSTKKSKQSRLSCPAKKPISLFPTAHFLFPSSWLNIFFIYLFVFIWGFCWCRCWFQETSPILVEILLKSLR